MGLGRQAACAVGVKDGIGRTVAPSHRDLPRAIRAGVGEGAQRKGFTCTFAWRLVGWCGDRRRDVVDRHLERSVVASRAVIDGDGDGEVAMGGIGMGFGRQTSRAVGVEDGMGRAIAPVDGDLPGAVRAGIGEGAKGKGFTRTLACRLGRGAVTMGATLLTVTWKEAWSLLTPSLTVTVAVKTPDAAIGMGLGRQAAGTVGVKDGIGRAIAPVDGDLPRAIRARIGEEPKAKNLGSYLAWPSG